MVAYAFDPRQHEARYGGGGANLPVGQGYVVMISDTMQEMTKEGNGGYLSIILKVIDGPLKDATHKDRLNLHNTNQMTVKIANDQLAAYAWVVGKGQTPFQDTVELHNIPFKIDIKQSKDPRYTEVAALYDINGNEPGKVSAAPQQQAYAAPPPQGGAPAPGAWGGPPQGAPQPKPGGWPQQQPQAAPQAQQPPAQGGWPQAGQAAPSGAPAGGGWPAQGGATERPSWAQ